MDMNFTARSMNCSAAGAREEQVMRVHETDGARPWPAELLYGAYRTRPDALAERVKAFREDMAPHIRAWARHGVHVALSPWRSPSWIGVVYGRVYRDADDFARHALEEYAECFGCCSLELGPYRLPSAPEILGLMAGIPPGFGVHAAVTHEMLMYRFPYSHPDPRKRGERNALFLDPGAVRDAVGPLLEILGPHLRTVAFRIPGIFATEECAFGTFVRHLDRFLASVPRTYRVAVELHNPEFFLPEYFACLRGHGAGAAVCAGDDLPPLLDQLQHPGMLESETVLLRTGHETPWPDGRRVPGPLDGETRLGILETVRRCVDARKSLTLDLGDRPEGAAPLALRTLMAMLDPELKKLSPLRRAAA